MYGVTSALVFFMKLWFEYTSFFRFTSFTQYRLRKEIVSSDITAAYNPTFLCNWWRQSRAWDLLNEYVGASGGKRGRLIDIAAPLSDRTAQTLSLAKRRRWRRPYSRQFDQFEEVEMRHADFFSTVCGPTPKVSQSLLTSMLKCPKQKSLYAVYIK